MRKILFYLVTFTSLTFCGCTLNDSESPASLGTLISKDAREEKIEAALMKLPGIERVTVSLWGKTALIGFLTEKGVSPHQAEELAGIIKSTVLAEDKDISYVSVSKNPELFGRITRLSEN